MSVSLYYVKTHTETKGPYTFQQLRAMWLNGVLTADMTCRPADGEWQRLVNVMEAEEPPCAAPVATPVEATQKQTLVQRSPYFAGLLPVGRIGRTDYTLRNLLALSLIAGCVTVIQQFDRDSFLLGILGLFFAYFVFVIAVKRLHDLGLSAWWVLVPLIPLALLVASGNADENKYGNRKLLSDANGQERIAVVMWIVLGFVITVCFDMPNQNRNAPPVTMALPKSTDSAAPDLLTNTTARNAEPFDLEKAGFKPLQRQTGNKKESIPPGIVMDE
jgi:uncharacterized membrane protein YhaH (DUF805 family)